MLSRAKNNFKNKNIVLFRLAPAYDVRSQPN